MQKALAVPTETICADWVESTARLRERQRRMLGRWTDQCGPSHGVQGPAGSPRQPQRAVTSVAQGASCCLRVLTFCFFTWFKVP